MYIILYNKKSIIFFDFIKINQAPFYLTLSIDGELKIWDFQIIKHTHSLNQHISFAKIFNVNLGKFK